MIYLLTEGSYSNYTVAAIVEADSLTDEDWAEVGAAADLRERSWYEDQSVVWNAGHPKTPMPIKDEFWSQTRDAWQAFLAAYGDCPKFLPEEIQARSWKLLTFTDRHR